MFRSLNMIQLLTIDFRQQQQSWFDEILHTSCTGRWLEAVVTGSLNQSPEATDLLPNNSEKSSVTYQHMGHYTQHNVEAIWQQRETPVDLVVIANYGDISCQIDFIEEMHQHQSLRESDVLVIDMAPVDRHEDHEIAALSAGVLDYWGMPLSTRRLSLRLQRLLNLRWERQQLEKMSAIDALTGVNNRRSLERNMTMEWRRAIRECHGIGVMMIDIDHFKAFNDFYGHIDGDHCLRHVATLIKDQLLRPCDFLSRYGGEEFIAILPNIRLNGIAMVADRIQAAIQQANIAHASNNHHENRLTVSIGMSWCEPDPSFEHEALLRAADKSLYKAKASGRNCVSDVVTIASQSSGILMS